MNDLSEKQLRKAIWVLRQQVEDTAPLIAKAEMELMDIENVYDELQEQLWELEDDYVDLTGKSLE